MRHLLLFVVLSVPACRSPVPGWSEFDLAGWSEFDLAGCAADEQCMGATPRCDVSSGRCVPCLPAGDNCPAGTHCVDTNGNFGCTSRCRNSADCARSDAGVPRECCDGICLETSIDVRNCGGCGKVCPQVANGVPACIGGTCRPVCASGFADCDGDLANGCESDTRSDSKNCGVCGEPCDPVTNGSNRCHIGACVVTCNDGFVDCDGNASNGCEIDKNSDLSNCGGCGTSCGPAPHAVFVCVKGNCSITSCDAGFDDCNAKQTDGCETNMFSDDKNCGGCGRPCAVSKRCPNLHCTNGQCPIFDGGGPGYSDCDCDLGNGNETYIWGDVNNCGACGHACAQGQACVLAICK